jgi:chaperone modulatory protein CbpM
MDQKPAGDPDELKAAVEGPVDLRVIARMAGVQTIHVRRYLEFGLFEPQQPRPTAPAPSERFDPTSAARVARAERLRRDLELNYAGAVLIVELLDRVSELEARLRRSPAD